MEIVKSDCCVELLAIAVAAKHEEVAPLNENPLNAVAFEYDFASEKVVDLLSLSLTAHSLTPFTKPFFTADALALA